MCYGVVMHFMRIAHVLWCCHEDITYVRHIQCHVYCGWLCVVMGFLKLGCPFVCLLWYCNYLPCGA